MNKFREFMLAIFLFVPYFAIVLVTFVLTELYGLELKWYLIISFVLIIGLFGFVLFMFLPDKESKDNEH